MDTNVFRTFVSVVDEGSFAAAAQRLGISRSLCSKHVADLEADLGVRLLSRSTRKVTPTAVGLTFHRDLGEVLARLDAATEAVRATTATQSGTLKIGSPIFYTLKVLQPYLLDFMEQYRDIRIQVVLDDGASDIIGEGFDAVIRIGTLSDSTLHARRLHSARILLVASPDYLARSGTPQTPSDLLRHDCLHYTNLPGNLTWPLRRGSRTIRQPIRASFSSNNTELLHSMALNGRGVALLPEFLIGDNIADGRLVALMTDYALPDLPVNLVYPSGKLLTGAMRGFLEFMSALRLT
ncbi:LysR family transcriptional regulator [Paracoccus sediminis]|uniref:DNA-binding transcriptional regulator, LysR family n=1 Tax=Paracoccus sediminis TaxID=1214787 RepID=A0A238Y416_9RHOB|nr:LysR family transcriptional regulator [Paracoccus sediminis]TBN47247.1 LysR family transcriptional regulator [Paracoccus sediminis]SNR65770.1 DNA-binding transcriptional regulator, LysR family [Paracoccus sediminis]